jgi:hypothetical protein
MSQNTVTPAQREFMRTVMDVVLPDKAGIDDVERGMAVPQVGSSQAGTGSVHEPEGVQQTVSGARDDGHGDTGQPATIAPPIPAGDQPFDATAAQTEPAADVAETTPPGPGQEERVEEVAPTEAQHSVANADQPREIPGGDGEPPGVRSADHHVGQTRLRRAARYGSPVVDAAAAGFSLATSRLAISQLPDLALAERLTGGLSGGLWALSAGLNEIGNAPHSKIVLGANVLGGIAGGLSLATAFTFPSDTKIIGLTSSASWLLNGFAQGAAAVVNTEESKRVRYYRGAAGAADAVAAALDAASFVASANSESIDAATLGTSAAIFWLLGATATALAEWRARQERQGIHQPVDLEGGTGETPQPAGSGGGSGGIELVTLDPGSDP